VSPDGYVGKKAALGATGAASGSLGWTVERYKPNGLWNATEQLTKAQFPYMFKCGPDGQSIVFLMRWSQYRER